ncbi:LacI family DNA-binding transcriptional regulator [Fodinicurvata sp. EGI_FJ10296]|uniref:LacI family DNA-binding transcriptional regulator n=1 Tax=Fodinicurvata sp. EGI_FJ10296 TaxID=3231908 RepID=UPI0034512939
MDVARAAGVSRTTVSNAFNRPDQLSQTLRDRVLSTAASIGYAGPNPMARMLRTGRAGAIGMVFPGPLAHAFTDPASVAFLTGVADGCDRNDVGLLFLPAENDSALGSVGQAAVDGFIVHCMAAGAGMLTAVLERNLPILAVDVPNAELPAHVSSVSIDDRGGAALAAKHVLALGHRNIGILSLELLADGRTGPVDIARQRGATYGVSAARLDGYLTTIERDGAAVTGIEETDVTDPAETKASIERLITADPRPTAILAMSDVLALMTLDMARTHGIRVPEDLSIVGFDDIPAAQHATPAMTTVHQPLREKGVIAVENLLTTAGVPSRSTLDIELRARASSGPPSSSQTL